MQQTKYLVKKFPSTVIISVDQSNLKPVKGALTDLIHTFFWDNWDLYFSMGRLNALIQSYCNDDVSFDHVRDAILTLSLKDQKRLFDLKPVVDQINDQLPFIARDWECTILFRSISKTDLQNFVDRANVLFDILILW